MRKEDQKSRLVRRLVAELLNTSSDRHKEPVSQLPEVFFFFLSSSPSPSLPSFLLFRFRASCEVGCVGGNGRPSCRITSALLMLKVWGRETRLCSPWWRQSRSMFTSSTSWSTASSGPYEWPPAPRSPPSAMTTSVVFSSTGLSWHKSVLWKTRLYFSKCLLVKNEFHKFTFVSLRYWKLEGYYLCFNSSPICISLSWILACSFLFDICFLIIVWGYVYVGEDHLPHKMKEMEWLMGLYNWFIQKYSRKSKN